MNFKTGRSAFVVHTLLHETDLNEAREQNQKLAVNGREARKKLDGAKRLTAMLNFRNIGCKIGEDTLNVRLKMLKNKKDNEDKVKQKKDNALLERKRKYHKIQSEIKEKNIPLHSLSISQLKILCTYKKKPEDKVSISKMKRNELLSLWTQWMHRNDDGIESSITINHIAKKQRNDEVLDCMEPVVPVPVPVQQNLDDGICEASPISEHKADDDENNDFSNVVLI